MSEAVRVYVMCELIDLTVVFLSAAPGFSQMSPASLCRRQHVLLPAASPQKSLFSSKLHTLYYPVPPVHCSQLTSL